MKARGRPRNIQKEPPREIISTTGKSFFFYVCSKQYEDIGLRHVTCKIKYDVDDSFLYSLNLLTLILSESTVPDRDTVF